MVGRMRAPTVQHFEIRIVLPPDRSRAGTLSVHDHKGKRLAGPFPVLGLSDYSTAKVRGNPIRDPLRTFGNTPTGSYAIVTIAESKSGSRLGELRSTSGYFTYGREGVIVLRALTGDAVVARTHGRTSIWLHGGELNSIGELRPTNGCLRVPPGVIGIIRSVIAEMPLSNGACLVSEARNNISDFPVASEGDDVAIDPPPHTLLSGRAVKPLANVVIFSQQGTATGTSETGTRSPDTETREDEGPEETGDTEESEGGETETEELDTDDGP